MNDVRLWVLSDLHLDFAPLDLTPPEHDVVVVAGDVSEHLCRSVLPWLGRLRESNGRPVVYVPGNHDFYGGAYQKEVEEARELASAADVTLLVEGDVAEHASLRFIGGTLWTDWDIRPAERVRAFDEASSRVGGLTDVRAIKWRHGPRDYSKFLPRFSASLHVVQRRRIESALAEPFDGRTVVVTHHAPHERSLRTEAWREPLDAAYASDLSAVLKGPHAPDLWIHGHIHEPRDYRVGGTRIVANPRGYVTTSPAWRGQAAAVKVENPGFNPALVVEV